MSKTCMIAATAGDFEYIDEWIQYHHNLGVELFLIGYNGPSDKFRNYRQYDYVKYIDFSYNRTNMDMFYYDVWVGYRQPLIYNILLMYGKIMYKDFTYFILVDTDEFIVSKTDNINDILDIEYTGYNYDTKGITMDLYCDSNNIYKQELPILDTFLIPKVENAYWGKKCVIRNGNYLLNNYDIMESAHTTSELPGNDDHFYNYQENVCSYDNIRFKHFWTKSLEEWIEKMNPNIDGDYRRRFKGAMLSTFFEWNDITDEKIKAIPELLHKYNINDYNIDDERLEELKIRYHKLND